MENTYLLVASSLCGGRAYAALERFFRLTLEMVGIERSSVYEDMGKLMEEAMIDNPLEVQTLFCGTRKQPDKRGEISNIDLTNLTPQQMIHGFMIGIAQELYPPYKEFCKQKKFTAIMASGNTVRKNKYFQQALSTVYSLPLKVTDFTEEAAYGAALYSMSTH
jgi:sedoheptulokinase